jgi:hypothetical protein
MTEKRTQRESFVIRIWRESGRSEWKGWIQHAGSGDSATLQDLSELMSFIERWTGRLSMEDQQGLK